MYRRFWHLGLVIAALLGGGAVAEACSLPVFRVALLDPRWRPQPYELYVFHDGPLGDQDRALLKGLNAYLDQHEGRVNVTLEVVDLAGKPSREQLDLWKAQGQGKLPNLIARYPERTGIKPNLWAGPLRDAPLRQLLDSPLRRELSKRLLAGESGVWVLIESGDAAKDAAALNVLTRQLKQLEASLTLAEPKPADEAKLARPNAPPLRLAFSVLRLSRGDPAERWLLATFLGMEDDLAGSKEPIVFPVFGRGIALYALVGKGIHEDNIAKAAGFLVGECSCEVREQNPGVDLLIVADWETGTEPPDLTHLLPEQAAGPAVTTVTETSTPAVRDGSWLLMGGVFAALFGLVVVGVLGYLLLHKGSA